MSQVHHSDVIGSLLRPKYLTRARDAYAAGQLTAPEFKRIEDRAVDEAIAMQEGIGLDVVTDGEFRRFSFLDQVVGEINGVEPIEGAPVHFKNATEDWVWHNPFTVTGKISQKRKITLEEFAYNRARATKQIKVTFPSPLLFYSAWSPELSTAAYQDAYELFADAAAIIRAECADLAALGCTYIQIDAPDIGTIVDPENRELRESLGMPTERTLTEGLDIFNSVGDVPGVTFGVHVCKGNNMSQWIGAGGYETDRRGHVRPADQLRRVPARVRRRAVRVVRAAREGARRQADHPRPGVEQDHHAGVGERGGRADPRGGQVHRA